MNKAELVGHLAEATGVSKKQAEDAIESFVAIVTQTLKAGGEVTIAGFGTFSAKQRAGRTGVNPQRPTEKIQIPAVTVPNLKEALK
jgi:DNA-binding protein HU-beta